MVYRPNIDEGQCFVLLPLRSPFLGYFEEIIKPAAREAGLNTVKADDIYGTRAVIKDIWESIWTARIVVAIVTDQNPNVNYELGMCHTLGVPTVLVTEREEDVPFDYRHRRYVRYIPRNAGWERKLFEDLRNTIKAVLLSPPVDDELPWPYNTFDLNAQRKSGAIIPSVDSLDSVVKGTRLVRHAIAPAFGPQGTRVSVNMPPSNRQMPFRSGYRIAQAIRSGEPLERQGIEQMRRLATDVFGSLGDGTKTALLLCSGMIERGREALRLGCIPKSLTTGMQRAVDVAATHIMTGAKPVDEQHLLAIAQTAGAADAAHGAIVVEAMKRVGKDGVVEVVDGTSTETLLDIQEGMQFDSGFLSQSFVTDTERQECILEDCYVLLYEGQIGSMQQFLQLLEQVARSRKPLLVIAGDVAQEPLAMLILNKERGALACAAVKTPGQGDRRKAMLQDMAILTGGKPFLQETMRPLEDANISDLGRAKRIIITKNDTTIIEGAGNPEEIRSRVQVLRRQIDGTLSPFDQAKLRERLAKLGGAVATLRPGGLTEDDRNDGRYRLESALYSCYSAVENGFVIGGGVCYYDAKAPIEKLVARNDSERYGIGAVSHALEIPLRQLIENSKAHNKSKVFAEVTGTGPILRGFNAETESVDDLGKAGVLDSARMLKETLSLAYAYAKGILTTGGWDAGSNSEVESKDMEF